VELGQFLTPMPVAELMASMLDLRDPEIRLLDPGAGIGSLTAAVVARAIRKTMSPKRLTVVAYEIDARLADSLRTTLKLCEEACDEFEIHFEWSVVADDFVAAKSKLGSEHSFEADFNAAILNPPYRKVGSQSYVRGALRQIGVDAPNLYAAFLAVAITMLERDGEFVSITPRSFCNGTYFEPFRRHLLDNVAIQRLHLFESRQHAFRDDDVLQENVILHARKSRSATSPVTISHSVGPAGTLSSRTLQMSQVVAPDDPGRFIRIVADEGGDDVAARMRSLPSSLLELGLTVSTGRVVDFRAKQWLSKSQTDGTVPLIYPAHFDKGTVAWPKSGMKKPNAIESTEDTAPLLVPNGDYVLVRRFSAKEERRRVMAVHFEGARYPFDAVGFENHVNYFHLRGQGLDRPLARGLTIFLNSTFVDDYFRQFNGHTQVNAGDLRSLRYPTLMSLRKLGRARTGLADQSKVDRAVEALLR
jgi:adenine-specific DNA-methyltransferase